MKLKKDFIIHNTGSECMLVAAGSANFSGLVKGNKTFGVILELLKKETSEKEIVDAMKKRFDAPEEVIAGDVRKALEKLRGIEALDE